MKYLPAIAALMLMACPVRDEPNEAPPSTTEAGGLECPGPQCPCPCEAPLFCEPRANVCTLHCSEDADCGGLSGERCLGGLCGVVCSPGGSLDCEAVGMRPGARCQTIEGTTVCGYPTDPSGLDGGSGPALPPDIG